MYILILVIVTVAIRYPFSLGSSTDTFAHLFFIKLSRKNRLGRHRVYQALNDGYSAYPNFHHYLISKLSRGNDENSGRALVLLWDVLTVVLVYSLLAFSTYFPPYVGVIAALLATTSPALLPFTARVKSIGARTFGLFLTTLLYLSWYCVLWPGSQTMFVVGVCSSAILSITIVASSQFAMQNLVFATLWFSIFAQTWMLPLSVIGGLVIGWFVPQTGIREFVVHFKINHYIRYFSDAHLGTTASNRTFVSDFVKLPVYLLREKGALFRSLSRTSILYLLLAAIPFFWLWLASEGWRFQLWPLLPDTFLFHLIAVGVVAALLTSLPVLRFLGQAERYLEFVVPAAALLVASTFSNIEYALGLVAANVFFAGINLALIRKDSPNSSNTSLANDIIECAVFVESLSIDRNREVNTLVVPTKMAYAFASLIDNENVKFYYPNVATGITGFQDMADERVWLHIPKADGDLSYWSEKYGVNTLVLDSKTEKIANEKGADYGVENLEKLASFGDLTVYSVPEYEVRETE